MPSAQQITSSGRTTYHNSIALDLTAQNDLQVVRCTEYLKKGVHHVHDILLMTGSFITEMPMHSCIGPESSSTKGLPLRLKFRAAYERQILVAATLRAYNTCPGQINLPCRQTDAV